MKLVIKIGGFVFPRDLSSQKIQQYADIIRKLDNQGNQVVVVTGGGVYARKYIRVGRELGASEYVCDLLGIQISRLNAYLLIAALGGLSYPEPPNSIGMVLKAFQMSKVVITGGMQPAQSTNAVAALCAEAVSADLLINATNIDGVYTSDPRDNPDARKFEVIESKELMRLILDGRMDAGTYELFDPVAIKIVDRSGIKTRILDGQRPENIEKAVNGETIGTLIIPRGR